MGHGEDRNTMKHLTHSILSVPLFISNSEQRGSGLSKSTSSSRVRAFFGSGDSSDQDPNDDNNNNNGDTEDVPTDKATASVDMPSIPRLDGSSLPSQDREASSSGGGGSGTRSSQDREAFSSDDDDRTPALPFSPEPNVNNSANFSGYDSDPLEYKDLGRDYLTVADKHVEQ